MYGCQTLPQFLASNAASNAAILSAEWATIPAGSLTASTTQPFLVATPGGITPPAPADPGGRRLLGRCGELRGRGSRFGPYFVVAWWWAPIAGRAQRALGH